MSGYGKSNPGPCWQLVDNLPTTYAHVSAWASPSLQHQLALKPWFYKKPNKQRPESHFTSFFSTFIGSSWWSNRAAILRALERVDWPHLSSWQEDFYISSTWTLLCSGRSPGPAFQIWPFFSVLCIHNVERSTNTFTLLYYGQVQQALNDAVYENMLHVLVLWLCRNNRCIQQGILTLILLQEVKQ